MNITLIANCGISACACNKQDSCHSLGITIGPHAECNTYVHASSRGGFPEIKGGIGACTASSCKFNNKLECQSPKVNCSGY
jgi:hypothetical protein